jgi:hypothetical protein
VLNFRHFGLAVGSPLARRNSLKVRHDGALYRRYFKSDEFDFNAFYVHSEARVAELVNLACAYYRDGDFSMEAEDRFCAAAEIDNLADPEGRRILDLPSLPNLPDNAPRKRRGLIPSIPQLPKLKRKVARGKAGVHAA